MSIWVICETSGGSYRSSTMELLSAARRMSPGASVAVVMDHDADAGALNGEAAKVVKITGAHLAEYDPETRSQALAALISSGSPGLVLFAEGGVARDLMPRVAAKLGATVFTNVVGLEALEGGLRITRPVMGGKAYAAYRAGAGLTLAAIRPNSLGGGEPKTGGTAFEEFAAPESASRIKTIERAQRAGRRVELTEAQAVVAAGRGLKAPENMKIVEDLADALGGAVGVSRAIVDAGWADHAIQVGKSGKTVSPALYIAAGISGAVHHTMGMDNSKVVVAINSDPKAPIFNYADYGIAGDALAVLPALAAEIRKNAG